MKNIGMIAALVLAGSLAFAQGGDATAPAANTAAPTEAAPKAPTHAEKMKAMHECRHDQSVRSLKGHARHEAFKKCMQSKLGM